MKRLMRKYKLKVVCIFTVALMYESFYFRLREHSAKIPQKKKYFKNTKTERCDNNDQLRIAAIIGGSRKRTRHRFSKKYGK